MEDRKNWEQPTEDRCPCGCPGIQTKFLNMDKLQVGNEVFSFGPISPVQALKDIVSSTEQLLKDGEINIEHYQSIVEKAVQGIKEIGLKNDK